MSEGEVTRAAELKGLTENEFREAYTTSYYAEGKQRWDKLLEKPISSLQEDDDGGKSCTFLGSDGRTCGIYEERPVQCRTYPYWPRLIKSKEDWMAEAVVPDDVPGKHWSPLSGGCEGISASVPLVDSSLVRLNIEMYAAFNRRFPLEVLEQVNAPAAAVMEGSEESDDDGIIPSVKKWVVDMVISLGLCPFASGVMAEEGAVRFIVTRDRTRAQIFRCFMAEVERLAQDETISTTLIILAGDHELLGFDAFFEFSTWLEDTIENEEALVDEVMLAAFHPGHTFAGLSPSDALNYEKRSPYPVLNILRAPQVDAYVEAGKTAGIAEHNEERSVPPVYLLALNFKLFTLAAVPTS
ncbi:unnamed protein product [Chrysoparadoxa australica]